jgi:hypothetical protein
MKGLFAIKTRYWLFLILPLWLFLTRYFGHFQIRARALEQEGIERPGDFQAFFIYNYLLAVLIMFLFLSVFFLLFKGITYLWQEIDSKKILKMVAISYCVFFIPDTVKSIYFNFFNPDFQRGEVKAFREAFYLGKQPDPFGESLTTLETILGSVHLMDFAFFIVLFVCFYHLFEDLAVSTITAMVVILAVFYFGFKLVIPLMMM